MRAARPDQADRGVECELMPRYQKVLWHHDHPIKKLFDEGRGIDETIRLRQGRITGATPEPGTSAAGPLSTVNDSPGLASTPISGMGPQPPTAGLPAGTGTPPRWVQLAFDNLDS